MLINETTENIILVDPENNEIGQIEKIRGHQYGMLHRAFSVCVFREQTNKIELLLQQRNIRKYHCGGLWSNTCCSHPHVGKDLIIMAQQRLKYEMGIDVVLTEVGTFHYIATLDHGMVENEIDHVLIGVYDKDEVSVNQIEVDDYLWIDVNLLHKELIQYPQKYTPWLKQALDLAVIGYRARMS